MNIIKDLHLDEISVVDRGAARDSRIKLTKSAPRRAMSFAETLTKRLGITPKPAQKPVAVNSAPVAKTKPHPLVAAAMASAAAAKR